MFITGVVLIPIFVCFLVILFTFAWGKAGRTEQGKKVLNKSMATAAPILPIGWLLLESYHSIIQSLTLSTYRDTMWVLIMLTFIVVGASLLRRKKSAVPA
ncbi:hypothetical protein [Halobacillus litoralis]|uniref:hypothetical protein n=1 Tax=Halobacillus litoralis TaxID=45668 RepID=UPI001CD3EBB8|nr:hypothetical protein [Halobacillus litoralis]MCA1020572.1 hypothetical protein [Halobacillus litoralis]